MIDVLLKIAFSFMVLAIALKLLKGEKVDSKIILFILAMATAFLLFPFVLLLAVLLTFYFLLMFLGEIWGQKND